LDEQLIIAVPELLMLNPDVVARLRNEVDKNPTTSTFEGYDVRHLLVSFATDVESSTVSIENSWAGECRGPDKIFGRPFDPSCLEGVGNLIRAASEKRLYRVGASCIIGNSAIMTSKGEIFSPSPVTNELDLKRAVDANNHNHQGFVLKGSQPVPIAYFAGRREPRQLNLDVLFLHNLEPGNYGSFLFRQLPQILFAQSQGFEFDAYVMPDRTPWALQALQACQMPQKPVFAVREVSGDIFRSITLANDFDCEGTLGPKTIHRIKNLCEQIVGSRSKARKARQLYASRRLSYIARPNYRQLVNEAEIEELAQRHGFEVLSPETLSFCQQIEVFYTATHVVGPSGSGMLNSLFCQPGSRVLDMESFHFTVRQHSKIYSSAGLTHAFLFGEIDQADQQPLPFRRWNVPLSLANEGLSWLLSNAG
jgi:Glycosyltransferase 61